MTARPSIQIEPVFRQASHGPDHEQSSASTPAYLGFAQFCQQIDALSEPSIVQLQGDCDPLLHLHFCDMVRYAVAQGHQVSTHTCLTALPEYRAEECIDCGLHTITIALDAADARTYQAIHGKARFDKIVRNLRRLLAAKARREANQPQVHLACTVMKKNLAQLASMVELAHEEGIDRVNVQHIGGASAGAGPARLPALYSYAGAEDLALVDPLRVAFHFNRARLRAKKLHIDLQLPKLPQLSSTWHWLHKTRRVPHFLRPPYLQIGKVASGAAPLAVFNHGESLPAALLAARSENAPRASYSPSRGNGAATELGQASVSESGTY